MLFVIQDKSKWHRWFAWYPVNVPTGIVWGGWVLRRRVSREPQIDDLYGQLPPWEWEYLAA